MKKNNIYLLFTFLLLIGCLSCKEETVGQTAVDAVAPGCIINPVVENIAGGATITYDLPADNDLLCVKAVYTINGQEKNTTASMYKNSLKVEGFGSTQKQTILLYTVDRSMNESEPVQVTIQPQTPPVETIFQTLTMQRDFGGIQVAWENTTKADISIYILAADSTGELSVADIVYTSQPKGQYSVRGYTDTERVFGAFIRDRWDNYSDTIQDKFIPFFEMQLEKTKWAKTTFPGDNNTSYPGWNFNKMWDGTVGDQGWHTGDGNDGNFPIRFTIDLGTTVKLSRYKLWHRSNNYLFSHFNPKRWKVYGTASPRFDLMNNPDYWQGDYKADWVHLLDCYSFKPSGEEGPVTQEDKEFAEAGFEFAFPLDAPPVRYLRFEIDQTWSGGSDVHISELNFWGKEEE